MINKKLAVRDLESTERSRSTERRPLRGKAGIFIARLGLAAVCIIPPADMALSDVATAKAYTVIQDKIEVPTKAVERGLELGATGLLIMAESVALGQVLSRNKKVQNAFDDFNDYQTEKHNRMGPVKKAVSKVVNSPFTALQYVGNMFERAGNRVEKSNSKLLRGLGKTAIDTGQVNALGTSTIIMEETMQGDPPSTARQVYLGGLIAGSWLGAAEGVRQVYRHVSLVRPPLAAFGQAYETLTKVNIANPIATPIGSLALGATIASLAYTGWKIEEYRQHRDEALQADSSD